MPWSGSWISATWVAKIIESKFRASNTLLNSAEYAIKRKEYFSFLNILPVLSISDVIKSSLSSKNTVCGPAERAQPSPSLPLSVGLTSLWACISLSYFSLDQPNTCRQMETALFLSGINVWEAYRGVVSSYSFLGGFTKDEIWMILSFTFNRTSYISS